jgi:predicted NACHT family NTPase
MSLEHFQQQDFKALLKKALKRNNREKVFFSKTSDDTVSQICNEIDNIVRNQSFNKNKDIVLLGFRMNDNRCEPIYYEISKKFKVSAESDIDPISLYALIALYLHENKIPTFKDIKKYIVYDAIYGSGTLFYNMSYV